VNGEVERIQAGLYGTLKAEASTVLGAKAGKPIVARYVARRLTEERNIIPPTIKGVIEAVQRILAPMEPKGSEAQPERSFDLDDEIPF
jgi:hypothetical protein